MSDTFAGLGLPADLLATVEGLGFEIPTPIQAAAIPALLSGRDVVGVAQTGTGKTAAFGLPLLNAVDDDLAHPQALVLTPTRELAIQVSNALSSFVPAWRRTKVLAIYGGASFIPQLRGLERGNQVVVGTPGRMIDLINRGALDLTKVRFVALDEADEMLRMGFAEDVETILAKTPTDKQVALFSATMPQPIRRVAQVYLQEPLEIAVTPQATPIDLTDQTFAVLPQRHKAEALARVLATTGADAAIVFVRTRETAEEVGSALIAQGVNAATISGDVAQRERERIVERLRGGLLDVLVATDVAARGLDVDRLGLVVNYDVPREVETYVHRIGRTGRAGRKGIALTFVTPKERPRLRVIEKTTGSVLNEVRIPTRADVLTHRLQTALAGAEKRLNTGSLGKAREAVTAFCENGIDPAELAAAFLALAVGDDGAPFANDDLAYRQDRDAEYDERERGRGRHERHHEHEVDHESDWHRKKHHPFAKNEKGDKFGKKGPARGRGPAPRFRVGVGHRDGATAKSIVGALTGKGGLRGTDIGKIDIFASFALVEIPNGLDANATRRISGATIAGRQLRIRPDEGAPPRREYRSDEGGQPRREY